MSRMTPSPLLSAANPAQRTLGLEWIALTLMVPMLASGLVFPTYDVAMPSLLLEILRQLNAPFLMAELVIICVATRHGLRLRDTWLRLDRPARIVAILFLSMFGVGGLLNSQSAAFATLFNLGYVIHAWFLVAVMHLAGARDRRSSAAFGQLVACSLLFFGIMTAIKFAQPPPGRTIESIEWQFALPGYISVRLFGAAIAPFLAMFVWLALEKRNEPHVGRWIHFAVAFASCLLVWSGTRAGVAGCGVAGLIAVGVFKLRPGRRALLPVATALCLGAAIGFSLVPYGDPAFGLISLAESGRDADGFTGGRISLWIASWQAFLPVMWFGAGPGATAWILPDGYWPHIQPHNFVLEFLLNWGLLASLAAFYLLARIVVATHRLALRERDAVPFVLIADCLLTIAVFDGTFHFAQHLMIWCAAVGIVFARSNPPSPAAPTSRQQDRRLAARMSDHAERARPERS